MTKIGQKRTGSKKPIKKKLPKDYELDALWSQLIRGLAGNSCVLCGENKKQIHAHHWVGRRYHATRWLIENGISVCHQCHQELHDFPEFQKRVIKNHIGPERMEQLELLARRGIGTKPDREAIKADLKAKIKLLEG